MIDLRNEHGVPGDRREQNYPEAPIWVDLDGIRIRVCCDRCVKKAEENPERTFRMAGVDPEKLKKEQKD